MMAGCKSRNWIGAGLESVLFCVEWLVGLGYGVESFQSWLVFGWYNEIGILG